MKAAIEIKLATTIKGRIKRNKEIPDAFIAIISKVSPRFPKVIMLDKSIASGSAKGIQLTTTKPINFNSKKKFNPLPTISSKYNQKNCSVKTKTAIKKVAKKGGIKALITSMSNFLNKIFYN